MAYVNTTRVDAPAHGLRARFAALVADLAERRARIKLYRQTISELSSLTDRELGDLGLNRSQIGHVATEAAYGK